MSTGYSRDRQPAVPVPPPPVVPDPAPAVVLDPSVDLDTATPATLAEGEPIVLGDNE